MSPGLAAGVLNAWLNGLCRATNWTAPVAFYVKLHIGDPGAAGTGNPAAETTRKATTFGSVASGGAIASTVDLVWTSVAATETYSYVSYWSAVTSGTFLGSAQMAAPRPVTVGDNFTFPAGDGSLALLPIAS